MNNEIDFDRISREEVRWRLLRVLDAGRPLPVGETLVFRAMHDVSLPLTPRELRRELDYLEGLELVVIEEKDAPEWLSRLTARGVDVVEYSVAAPVGIKRPRKYW